MGKDKDVDFYFWRWNPTTTVKTEHVVSNEIDGDGKPLATLRLSDVLYSSKEDSIRIRYQLSGSPLFRKPQEDAIKKPVFLAPFCREHLLMQGRKEEDIYKVVSMDPKNRNASYGTILMEKIS
jgi:hypothetical protein